MEIGLHIANDPFYLMDLPRDRRVAVLGFLNAKMNKDTRHKRAEKQAKQADMRRAFLEQGATDAQIAAFMESE